MFGAFETGLVGVQPDNATEQVDNLSYVMVVGMLLVDAVLYGLIALYLEQV